jgi:hypothetical protein
MKNFLKTIFSFRKKKNKPNPYGNKKKRQIFANNYDTKNIVSSDYYYHSNDSAREILLLKKEEDEKSIFFMAHKLCDVFIMMDRMKNYPKFRKEYSLIYVK